MFEAPNLDSLSVSPAAMDEASRVLSLLASYAAAKAQAMRHRLETKDIEAALSFEKNCDATYQRLPEWARW